MDASNLKILTKEPGINLFMETQILSVCRNANELKGDDKIANAKYVS
jgi:hypothetical protein